MAVALMLHQMAFHLLDKVVALNLDRIPTCIPTLFSVEADYLSEGE